MEVGSFVHRIESCQYHSQYLYVVCCIFKVRYLTSLIRLFMLCKDSKVSVILVVDATIDLIVYLVRQRKFTLPTIVEIAILLSNFRAPILLVGYLVK